MSEITPSNSVGNVAGRFGQPNKRKLPDDKAKNKKQNKSADKNNPKAETKQNGVGENIDIEA